MRKGKRDKEIDTKNREAYKVIVEVAHGLLRTRVHQSLVE